MIRLKTVLNKAKLDILITVFIQALYVYLLVQINKTLNPLYSSMETRNAAAAYAALFSFSKIAALLVIVTVYANYLTNKLSFKLRTIITETYTANNRVLYRPDVYGQRIQEDVRNLTENSVNLAVAVFISLIKLPTFTYITIKFAGPKAGAIILLVCFAGTFLVNYISKSLIKYQSNLETEEAHFRSSLDRINNSYVPFRDIYLGNLTKYFNIVNNKFKILTFAQSVFGQTLAILPFLLLMPVYLSNTGIALGDFMQAVSALNRVADSLSIFIDSRQTVLRIVTAQDRLKILG